MTRDNSANNPVPNFYRASAADFKKIPGSPIAYWVSDTTRDIFEHFPPLGTKVDARVGLMTSDNDRFLRFCWEVPLSSICYDASTSEQAENSEKRWFPHNKGGSFRKWAGNQEYLVDWENNGRRIKQTVIKKYPYLNGNPNFVVHDDGYYFKPAVSWSEITSGNNAFRHYPNGFTFNVKGMCVFPSSECSIEQLLVFCNSKFVNFATKILNPTTSFGVGNFNSLPSTLINHDGIVNSVHCLVNHAQKDWDSYEISWNFSTLPLLQYEYHQPTISETYTKLRAHWQEMTLEMRRLEEENNRIFIEAYGLQDELTPEVPLSEITLTCNPHYRYKGNKSEEELGALLLTDTIKEFISYAVGCMFGRYSLDKPGLILANQGETINDYVQQVPEPSFMPDDDNIIPILEDEYFTDDIVGRFKEFLKATFGAESLAENLEFISGALSKSKKGSASPEKVIRDYFLKSFFKDHVKMYKKRPIYWLFTSGKGRGFNALVYMHRYNRETLAKMRTDYLLELEAKLDARIGMLGDESAAEKGRLGKQIEELAAYDEVLHNKSLEYIDIDLDDGVKVNYAKFEGWWGRYECCELGKN
uniref:BREX-1 system adenine-specific DNA-methyltransferase PglX n=1 Tax=Candidatus Methanogaster sp. ANME-2c ERB4 TaxID=2759911 RepID=A0A7G9YP03_9EURY|nr:hypothetical protein BFOKDAJI_00010 [Methanosarcinales archaeon ANME-2c ERB4]QNO49737.1 hypothetical protein BFOKDAJI_00039 [Methanosarcinales archaeon ANME-2c ERB4]